MAGEAAGNPSVSTLSRPRRRCPTGRDGTRRLQDQTRQRQDQTTTSTPPPLFAVSDTGQRSYPQEEEGRRESTVTRDETAALLRARSAMTTTPYGAEAIDTWHAALAAWSYDQVRPAMIRAARDQKRVTVADVTALLPPRDSGPQRRTEPSVPPHPCGCPNDKLCEHDIERNLAGVRAGRAALERARSGS